MAARRETVDLARMVRALEARLRDAAPGRRVELSVDEPLIASGNASMLELALAQLLELSWQVTRAREVGRVHVGSLVGPDGTAYFVRDNGLGAADPDDPDLAEVAAAVRWHGGRLWTEAAPGAGVTIYFTLGA